MANKSSFEWKCEPEAEKIVLEIVQQATSNPTIAKLQQQLHDKTSTRLFDWLDHVTIGKGQIDENRLNDAGYTLTDSQKDYRVFRHLGAQLPAIVVNDKKQQLGLALLVENISDFMLANGGAVSSKIEGTTFSGYRRWLANPSENIALWIVERRGTLAMDPIHEKSEESIHYQEAMEIWKKRPRVVENDEEGFKYAFDAAKEIVKKVGKDKAAWIILEVERDYWQTRNTAGQLQKNRQDRLGMGWANHDHHTFRSSRRNFINLVALFEMLGFHCRERFYAGREAGWGAQVMENPACRLVLFLDVDLGPDEIAGDFAHESLPELTKLGTIGLWCGLHGDSILHSGMHHLEAQFMFDSLKDDLAKIGVNMMDPFSFLPHLKQAFTVGENWHVDPKRVQKLLKEGKITREQADKFTSYGAIGSHMENLQRREGFKGFNSKNVSTIIKETDPRFAEGA